MKYFVAFLLIFTACSKQEQAAPQDSLLTTPLPVKPAPPPHTDSTGLWVDSSVVAQQNDMEVLKGFDPKRVVELYLNFRPLRKPTTSISEVDSFLSANKITEKQLHSVLAEGDRLGWARAK